MPRSTISRSCRRISSAPRSPIRRNTASRTRYDTDPTNPGLYDGPYRITEVAPGSHIVFERNPFWWGEAALFPPHRGVDGREHGGARGQSARPAIDMVAGELGFPLDEALAFEQRHGEEFRVIYKPGLIYEHIDLNLDIPILADLRVRQALLFAIDRKAISEELFAGRDPVADSFVPPLDWIYTDEVPHYPYDPAQARALLEEAGWHRAGGAIRRNDAGAAPLAGARDDRGQPHPRAGRAGACRASGAKSASMSACKNQPARVLFGETLTKRNFAMAMFAWISAPENVPRSMLHSDEIPSAANGWTGQNYAGLPQSRGRPPHRRDRSRARPRPAAPRCGTRCSALCRGTAGAAALFPRRRPSSCRNGSRA